MRLPIIATTSFLGILLAGLASAAPVAPADWEDQAKIYRKWWGGEIERRWDRLPLSGAVPKGHVPYAGSIYPDRVGGTAAASAKYDRAFNGAGPKAAKWERWDIEVHKERGKTLLSLFGVRQIPHWAGHCNGWTAAALRHAEPHKAVYRRGVRFDPSDIKALLAELYTYNDVESLAGDRGEVNPAALHIVLANWLGRHQTGLGMDATVGKEVWNYPIYSYRAAGVKRGTRLVEVRMNLGFVYMLDTEQERAPANVRYKPLHYKLELDHLGRIVGGDYYRGSEKLDMLWAPLPLKQGGTKGNEAGNPRIDVKNVLAMWRDSVPQAKRLGWSNDLLAPYSPTNRNPVDEESVVDEEQIASTEPVDDRSEETASDQPDEQRSEFTHAEAVEDEGRADSVSVARRRSNIPTQPRRSVDWRR